MDGIDRQKLEYKDAMAVESTDAEQGVISGFASRYGNVDRDGDVFEQGAFAASLDTYMVTGPILWMHDYDSEPIGRTFAIEDRPEGVFVQGKLAPVGISEKADLARKLLKADVLRGLSVGFLTQAYQPIDARDPFGGRRISQADFAEWSPVSVGSNPLAVVLAYKSLSPKQRQMVEPTMDAKRVAPFADLPLHEGEEPWVWTPAAANEILGEDRWDRYAKAHAWADPAQRNAKSGYRLPFGIVVDGELHASIHGVKAAMASLLGARGGAQIPDEDRKGAYDHLSSYYQKAGLTPPEFHQAGESFSWSWFSHDEQKCFEHAEFAGTIHRLHSTITEARQFAASRRRAGWDPLDGSEDVGRRALATLEDLLGRKGQSLDLEGLLRSVGFDSVQQLTNAAQFVGAGRVEGSA